MSHLVFSRDAIGTPEEIIRIRSKIARHGTCAPGCAGWAVFNSDTDPELDVCNDCWANAADPLTLDEVEALPEAEHELALAVEDGMGYSHPRVTVPCACGCVLFRTQGSREQCSGCGSLRERECHCAEPGGCDICAPESLTTVSRRLLEQLRIIAADRRDPESALRLLNLCAEAEEVITAHEEAAEAVPPAAPNLGREEPTFVAVLAALDRAEGIHGPEGDDYVKFMRAVEDEARARRMVFLKNKEK